MTILLAAVVGAAIGAGALIGFRALRPGPPRLASVLASFQHGGSRGNLRVVDGDHPPPLVDRLGGAVLAFLDATGLFDTGRLRLRLRVLGRSPQRHAFSKLAAGAAGFAAPLLVAATVAVAGVGVSPGWVTAIAFTLGIGGFFLPDLGLADWVEAQRRGFRHALSAYLDLVTIILAGGGGLETALHGAADSGEGWAFSEIRRALHRARLSGDTPWDAFERLGADLGVEELSELAASARLAGDHGARIRASLSAKADSLRAHQTAAAEAQAEAATEKMLLPVVGLVVGMILFIGYGVTEAISTPPPIVVP